MTPLQRAARNCLYLAAGIGLAMALLLSWPWLCEQVRRAEARAYMYAKAIGGR